jgi:hypothetical protein
MDSWLGCRLTFPTQRAFKYELVLASPTGATSHQHCAEVRARRCWPYSLSAMPLPAFRSPHTWPFSRQQGVRQHLGLVELTCVDKSTLHLPASTESYRACNETFEGGGERREGREKSIVHLSVEVTSAPSDQEVANLSYERL